MINKDKLIQCDKRNRNGRIYPAEVFQKAIDNYQSKITDQLSYGQLMHPTDDYMDMSVKDISHRVLDIKLTYPKVPRKMKKKLKKLGLYQKTQSFATYELLTTPKGILAKNDLHLLTPSPRGIGKINEDGVVTDFELVAVDLILKTDKS